MKKIGVFLLCFVALLGAAGSSVVFAAEVAVSVQDLQIGDYFTLGEYNGEPIVWRYAADDENGKLIVSDKILCIKPSGNIYKSTILENKNFWQNSYIREWLNSTASEGEKDWGVDISYLIKDDIDTDEKGFLHVSNFSLSERSVMKQTSQWTMLPEDKLYLSENGNFNAYNAYKKYVQARPQDGGITIYYDISELPDIYAGAAHITTDTVFLLDEMQVCNMLNNLGDVRAVCANGCMYFDDNYSGKNFSYILRTPTGSTSAHINEDGVYGPRNLLDGIRPAFYLNEENAQILSGSGTAEDPYVMDGKKIEILINGEALDSDYVPVIENGIVLVPIRAVFEKMGAEVVWNDEDQSITVVKDKASAYMMISNGGIMINGEIQDLGYPVTLIDDAAYAPLTAIEKFTDTDVVWNARQTTVEIAV